MLVLFLKWLTIALVVLAVFSGLTALYGLYALQFGSCASGCDNAASVEAYKYVGLVGLTGFGVSAYAAHKIGQSFKRGNF